MGLMGDALLEVKSLLKWSMLAACTVGPGTVIVCAKSGADFGLDLIWTLVAATFVAFLLQEEAARLSMCAGGEGGMPLGQALRMRFNTQNGIPAVCYVAVIGVFIGNCAYEANCFVGAVASLFVLYEDNWWFRLVTSVGTAVGTLLALFLGDVDQIGEALGVIVVGMSILFLVVALDVDFTGREFGEGLVPSIPSGSSVTVLSMVATTCIPFNMFLAASMVQNCPSTGQMQRGVAFASFMTCLISIMVVVVGSGIDLEPGTEFTVESLGESIRQSKGETAAYFFCIGLYAASYSSAIAMPLGIACTLKQVFLDGRNELPSASAAADSDGKEAPLLKGWTGGGSKFARFDSKGIYFRLSMVVCVVFATVVAAAGAPTVPVVFAAQVVNGILLPFLTVCLVLCVDEPRINPYPPNLFIMCCLMFAVFLTSLLAMHTILDVLSDMGALADIEGWNDDVNILTAACAAFVLTFGLTLYLGCRRTKRKRRESQILQG